VIYFINIGANLVNYML